MIAQGAWTVRATGGPSGGMVADAAEVRRALELFADPDGWCQLVGLPSAVAAVCRSNDLDGLCSAANDLPSGHGLFFQINPVRKGLTTKAKAADITRRRWLFIDVDPRKAAGAEKLSATDREKELALAGATAIHDYLDARGWPAPVVIDSGNGWYLLYRIDLPNDELTRNAIRALLYHLAGVVRDLPCSFDKSVHNADRLAKLPGTWARKGVASDDRPHRVAKIVCVPEPVEIVPFESIRDTPGQKEESRAPDGHSPWTTRATAGAGDRAYAVAALNRERVKLALTPPGDRDNQLYRSGAALGELVGDGRLSDAEVWEALTGAAADNGLLKDIGEEQVRDKLRRSIEKGKSNPRVIPERNGAKPQPPKPAPDGELILWASDVTPSRVEWLMPGRIPLGKLTTFAGNGGLGKTFVLCDIVARITRGAEWPYSNGECAERGKCLFISGEDDPDDTLVPRMIELGADLSRAAFLRTEVLNRFTLADLPTLDKALAQMGPGVRFVAIDPPTAYLGGVNDHKNAELRGLLTPLMLWAKRHRLAVVFNTHVNKPQGAKVEAMMRVMGSVAWVNAMRSAYMFARDPEDGERRLFVGMKNNLGAEKKGLAYRIASTESLARVEWLGEVDTTADDAVNNQKGSKRRAVVAAEWLASLFAESDKIPSKTVFRRKRDETTLSDDALREAKEEMGIKARQECDGDGDRQWFWHWSSGAKYAWEHRADGPPGGSDGQPDGH